MRWGLLLILALLLPGCLGAIDEPAPAEGPRAPEAPWWNVGESWTVSFERAGEPTRTTTLVNFANGSWDPAHFWLGVEDRDEALSHVFFDDNPFLGRIHWEILAPHEKGMHSVMYTWPLEDGAQWDTGRLFGTQDVVVRAQAAADGTFAIEGSDGDSVGLAYDYDPATRWFRELEVREDGKTTLRARVVDHEEGGAKGTYYFLRGRDYLDSSGGSTGQSQPFTVEDEGATSVAFLLDVRTSGPAHLEFVAPDGEVWHRETLATGGTSDKVVEVDKAPPPGEWALRYVGSVEGTIKVRGIIEYSATL